MSSLPLFLGRRHSFALFGSDLATRWIVLESWQYIVLWLASDALVNLNLMPTQEEDKASGSPV